jgi:hypothetical protein
VAAALAAFWEADGEYTAELLSGAVALVSDAF